MSLDNYEPVAVRLHRILEQIRSAGQTPSIRTQLLSEPGANICVFRAELWIDGALIATGHAEEVRGEGNVNRTSHLENCETSSLGRMCEAFAPNPDWTKRPSREEMSKTQVYSGKQEWRDKQLQRESDALDSRERVFGPSSVMTGGISEKQAGYIRGTCKRADMLPPADLDSWSKQDASNWIDAHKNGTPPAQCPRPTATEEPF